MDQVLGTLIVAVGSIAALGYVPLQVLAFKVLRGGRRGLALVPLCGMLPVLAVTLTALVGGSNLWPILLLFTAPLATLYLVVLLVVHSIQTKGNKNQEAAR